MRFLMREGDSVEFSQPFLKALQKFYYLSTMKKIRETGLDFIIREPLDVDFFVDPKPLTKEENKLISDFIKIDKQKRRLLKTTKKAFAHKVKN